jgi:glycosyltransferase involved in cell wall biosynthesis
MAPLVSVVLPTYNRAHTLERAVFSVLRQSFQDFELIIVDDGSTDGSKVFLDTFSRLECVQVIQMAHRGCGAARNRGIEAAIGRYIAFQDSDDEWLPGKLEIAVAALEQAHPEVGVFYSDMLRIADGGEGEFRSAEAVRGTLIDEATLDYQVFSIGMQSAVIRRECFELVGLFDEALPRFIDLDMFIRLSQCYEFIHDRRALVRYYAGEGISSDHHARVVARRHLMGKYRHDLRRQRHHLAGQYLKLAEALKEDGDPYRSYAWALRALLMAANHARVRKCALELLENQHG